MAHTPVLVGAAPNDNTGDQLRTAFQKLNNNLTELYNLDIASMSFNAGTGVLTVTLVGGGTKTVTISTAADVLTTLSYNAGTHILTYKDELGANTNIDLTALATDVYVNGGSYDANLKRLTLTDNSGPTPDVVIDLSGIVPVLVNNLDGTYNLGDGRGATSIGVIDTRANLTYTAATRVLASSTGSGTALPNVAAGADSGLMTGADKLKLDGIASGAQVNVATDLTYNTATRLLASSTGTDVTLPNVAPAGDSGLMTGADKTKLDGIASGAQVNATIANNLITNDATQVLSAAQGVALKAIVDGLGDIQVVANNTARDALTGLDAGDIIHVVDRGDGKWERWQVTTPADGTWLNATKTKIADQDTLNQVATMVGASVDGATPGAGGYVTAPAAGLNRLYLRGDGTWGAAIPGFAANTYYKAGVAINVSNVVFVRNADGTSGATFDNTERAAWIRLSGNIPLWEASTYYRLRDFVWNGKSIYKRKADGVSGATFDATELTAWDVVGTGDDVVAAGASGLMSGSDKTKLDGLGKYATRIHNANIDLLDTFLTAYAPTTAEGNSSPDPVTYAAGEFTIAAAGLWTIDANFTAVADSATFTQVVFRLERDIGGGYVEMSKGLLYVDDHEQSIQLHLVDNAAVGYKYRVQFQRGGGANISILAAPYNRITFVKAG